MKGNVISILQNNKIQINLAILLGFIPKVRAEIACYSKLKNGNRKKDKTKISSSKPWGLLIKGVKEKSHYEIIQELSKSAASPKSVCSELPCDFGLRSVI